MAQSAANAAEIAAFKAEEERSRSETAIQKKFGL
jgi:hypothetical protein